jgi:hypothetical protein
MKIGYASVSTQDHRLNLQLEALHKGGANASSARRLPERIATGRS